MSTSASIKDNYSEFQIVSCYDSHVHWLMTGEKKSFLNLEPYTSITQISASDMSPKAFKVDWLMGFGWMENQFEGSPHYSVLDKISAKHPICFIKKDAHSCVLNSLGLKYFLQRYGKDKEVLKYLELDSGGQPTGVLQESTFYALYGVMPVLTSEQIKDYLLTGQQYFLSHGITHIRDMTCTVAQWKALKELENKGQIKLQAEINFNVENLLELETEVLDFVLKEKTTNYPHLSIQGIKFFYDGSLGSETALLSSPYKSSGKSGLQLWQDEDVKQAIRIIWEKGLQVSIHTLGDEAVKKVVRLCKELQKEKITGIINLEHVELISLETINEMKSLHVRCHLQPSHWLSDKHWIKTKLDQKQLKYLFQWEQLRKSKVPFYFGSDSPIEEANIFLILQALEDSEKNAIPKLNDKPELYFSHPHRKNGLSKFKNESAMEVYLDNECVFKRN